MTTIIIIPYRDREEHLKYFKNNAIQLLKKYIPDIKIIVVEQAVGKLFNKGKLLEVVNKINILISKHPIKDVKKGIY